MSTSTAHSEYALKLSEADVISLNEGMPTMVNTTHRVLGSQGEIPGTAERKRLGLTFIAPGSDHEEHAIRRIKTNHGIELDYDGWQLTTFYVAGKGWGEALVRT